MIHTELGRRRRKLLCHPSVNKKRFWSFQKICKWSFCCGFY